MTRKRTIPQPLQELLTARINRLFEQLLGHQPREIAYQVFDESLVIVMEDAVTKTEQLLARSNRKELALKVRSVLDSAILPQLRQSIEEVMEGTIVDFLSDTTIETGRTGAIAIFELRPRGSKAAGLTPAQQTTSH